MGKYRRYKNIIEMFLASEKGRRTLNFCYSWGASVIIIGAMFKILHLPYANIIIGTAMTFEAFVFFIFAFERPTMEYNWEEVFPVLKSKNPLDRPHTNQVNTVPTSANEPNRNQFISKETSQTSTPFSPMEGMTEVTQDYMKQMEQLNHKIAELNTLYEKQMQGAMIHTENMEMINNGLNRMRDMYESSLMDSTVFRTENERMAQQLVQLNNVYSRLLHAMTINMPGAGMYGQPYYQQPPTGQPYTPPNQSSGEPDADRNNRP